MSHPRSDWQQIKSILDSRGFSSLFHFTDRDNIKGIIENGGLYSWKDCEDKGISIPKPGGGQLSRKLDGNLGYFVRISFTRHHPMMYVAMNEGRISNPVILEIDPEAFNDSETIFADRNATKNGCQLGNSLTDFKAIHFDTVRQKNHFDLSEDERPFYQAEILVPHFIPLKFIRNIADFGCPLPSKPSTLMSRDAYIAQITRNTPTAFIFLIDQSVSMQRQTSLDGIEMSLAEAAAQIVNRKIRELILRCTKADEIRHYFDIAVIGYSDMAYSGWTGKLKGRYFVSPQEIHDNATKVTVKELKRTPRGFVEKEVEHEQWLDPRSDGGWTHLDQAVSLSIDLLSDWLIDHRGKEIYPPTVINITDGEYNGCAHDRMQQLANELKSLATSDGNVLFFNCHIQPGAQDGLLFPASKDELGGDSVASRLFDISSLLPLRYNDDIARAKGISSSSRLVAMGVNASASQLIQLMDIGTPTNIK